MFSNRLLHNFQKTHQYNQLSSESKKKNKDTESIWNEPFFFLRINFWLNVNNESCVGHDEKLCEKFNDFCIQSWISWEIENPASTRTISYEGSAFSHLYFAYFLFQELSDIVLFVLIWQIHMLISSQNCFLIWFSDNSCHLLLVTTVFRI